MGSYRLLADHYIADQLFQAGSIISDAVLPSTWVPTLACDPTDSDGLQKFFNAGPTTAMGSAEHGALSTVFNGNRWTGIAVAGPVHYWKQSVVGGVPVWQVQGAENLGWRN